MPRFKYQHDASLTLPERMTKDLLQNQDFLKFNRTTNNFLTHWFPTLSILSATKPSPASATLTLRFPVTKQFLNPMGTLHAGATSAMFECATTWCLYPIAREEDGFWGSLGICRNIAFTYLRPVGEGEMVLMECATVHVGKRIALVRGELKRERDGAVLVTCEHNKYNVDADAKL